MNRNTRMRGGAFALALLAAVGGLASGPIAARAADPPPKDKTAGKGKKQDNIPIKIVAPIIVPDKGKDSKDAGKQGK